MLLNESRGFLSNDSVGVTGISIVSGLIDVFRGGGGSDACGFAGGYLLCGRCSRRSRDVETALSSVSSGGRTNCNLRLADDIDLLGGSKEELQNSLED